MPNTPNNNSETQNSLNIGEFVTKIEVAKDPNIKYIIALLKLVSDNIEDSRVKDALKSQDVFLRNIVINSAVTEESKALAEDFVNKKESGEIDYNIKKYIYRIGNLLKSAFNDDLIQSLQAGEPDEGSAEGFEDTREEPVEKTEDNEATEPEDAPDILPDLTEPEPVSADSATVFDIGQAAENNEAIGPLSVKLSVVKDGKIIKEKIFNQDAVKIGALASIDSTHLYIDDPDVSRMHAVIDVRKNGGRTIFDLGSETGIMVNGNKATKSLLNDGDVIQLGSVEIQFADLLKAVKDDAEEAEENIFGTDTEDTGSIEQSLVGASEEAPEQESSAPDDTDESEAKRGVSFYTSEMRKFVDAGDPESALILSKEALEKYPETEVLYIDSADIALKLDLPSIALALNKKLLTLTNTEHMKILIGARIKRLEEKIDLTEAESDDVETPTSGASQEEGDETADDNEEDEPATDEETEPENNTEEARDLGLPFRPSFMPGEPESADTPSEAPEVVDKMLREMNGEPEVDESEGPLEPLPRPFDASVMPLDNEDPTLTEKDVWALDQEPHWDLIIIREEGYNELRQNIDPSRHPEIRLAKQELEMLKRLYKEKFNTDYSPVEGEGLDAPVREFTPTESVPEVEEKPSEEPDKEEDVGTQDLASTEEEVEIEGLDDEGEPVEDVEPVESVEDVEPVESVEDVEPVESVEDTEFSENADDLIVGEEEDEDIESDTYTPKDMVAQMPVTEELNMLEIGEPLNVKENDHVRLFTALNGNKITVENNAVATIDILFSGANIQLDENNSFVVINKTSENCQGNPVEIIIKGKEKEGFDPVILGPKASKEHISVLYLG